MSSPEPAKTIADIEKKMAESKANIMPLKELGDKATMTSDQTITILIGILQNSIMDYIITKHDIMKGDYDEVGDTLYDYLARIEIKEEKKKQSPLGGIGSVGSEGPESESPDADWDYIAHFYDTEWNMWLCTTTERPATEPGQSVAEASLGSKGDAKGKGKGKSKGEGKGKGPKGGCHECGGDHYVRECPVSKGKSKGKGKDWSAVPKNTWNRWYSGPSQHMEGAVARDGWKRRQRR